MFERAYFLSQSRGANQARKSKQTTEPAHRERCEEKGGEVLFGHSRRALSSLKVAREWKGEGGKAQKLSEWGWKALTNLWCACQTVDVEDVNDSLCSYIKRSFFSDIIWRPFACLKNEHFYYLSCLLLWYKNKAIIFNIKLRVKKLKLFSYSFIQWNLNFNSLKLYYLRQK